jgi:hypothetical protein
MYLPPYGGYCERAKFFFFSTIKRKKNAPSERLGALDAE